MRLSFIDAIRAVTTLRLADKTDSQIESLLEKGDTYYVW
jgi:hypothetical protein